MISRNQIRQAAAQYLYGLGMDKTEDAPSVDDARMDDFWSILLEPQACALNKAKAKVIAHLTRDYAEKARLFATRAKDFIHRLEGDIRSESLRESLKDIATREEAFEEALLRVRSAIKDDPECETDAAEKAFDGLKILNDTLIQFRTRFLNMLEDCPEYAGQAAGLVKAVKQLQGVGERLVALDNPKGDASDAEFQKVIEIREDMQTLRSEADELIRNVVAKSDELDELTDSILENYSGERISPVERAIIRIAAYELKYREELPTAVIASEAIRLAERYSSTEAPRFINGLLGGIARKCREDEPEAPSDN